MLKSWSSRTPQHFGNRKGGGKSCSGESGTEKQKWHRVIGGDAQQSEQKARAGGNSEKGKEKSIHTENPKLVGEPRAHKEKKLESTKNTRTDRHDNRSQHAHVRAHRRYWKAWWSSRADW